MRILAISNLYDIFYDDLNDLLIKYRDYYDLVALLDNIDVDILYDINDILKLNNIYKEIFIDNTSYSQMINYDIISYIEPINDVKCIDIKTKIDNKNSDLNTKYNTKKIFISKFNPNKLNAEEITNLIENSNINKDSSLFIYSDKRFNTISMVDGIYTIGISGVSIIDISNGDLIKLY